MEGMNCHECGQETKVIDSRARGRLKGIRRRRECASCGIRFSTFEILVQDERITELLRTLYRIRKIAASGLRSTKTGKI